MTKVYAMLRSEEQTGVYQTLQAPLHFRRGKTLSNAALGAQNALQGQQLAALTHAQIASTTARQELQESSTTAVVLDILHKST